MAPLELTRAVGEHGLAIRLRRARLEAGWSIQRAVPALRVSEACLRRLEAGQERIRLATLVRAGRVYQETPTAMLPCAADLRLAQVVAKLDEGELAAGGG